MKHLLSILLIVCGFTVKQGFSQDSLRAKYNGECLISGGKISLADFKKLHSLCPPKLTKVIHYEFRYQPNGKQKKDADLTYIESNLDFQQSVPKAKAGDIIIFDEITGLGSDKKRGTAKGIVLLIE